MPRRQPWWRSGQARRGKNDHDIFRPHQTEALAGHTVERHRVVLQALDAALEESDAFLGAGDLGRELALAPAHRGEIPVALQAEGRQQQGEEDHHRNEKRAERMRARLVRRRERSERRDVRQARNRGNAAAPG